MNEDWIECELGEVFNITYGKGLPTKKLTKEGFPVYGANGIIGFYHEYKYEKKQVLISCRGAASGKINISPEKCFITNNSLVIESDSSFILKKFLYFILSGANRSQIVTGSAQPQVTINNANTLLIKLAPLPIQRAIVSKIEALFSDLDNGIANLKKAQEQLKVYRQAVLKKAFEGELTKEWREKQTKLPTAEELLKQIKEERQNHYNQQIEDWKKAVKDWEKNGKIDKKPSKPSEYKTFNSPVSSLDLNIPDNWIITCIGNLCSKTEYGSSEKSLDDGDVPVIRMGNMQNGQIDWVDLKYSSNPEEIKQYSLKKGDVLFNRTNSPELVGKTVIYKGERQAIFAGYLIRLNHIENIVSGSYLNYFLNSHPAKVYGSLVKTDGVNQSNINGEKLSNYPFPLCSTEEQTQIVQEIESRLSVTDNLEIVISNSIEKAEALRQSILKKAFEGKLLSEAEIEQCKAAADYEPASELLKKIQAEKLAKEQEKKKKPTVKKKIPKG